MNTENYLALANDIGVCVTNCMAERNAKTEEVVEATHAKLGLQRSTTTRYLYEFKRGLLGLHRHNLSDKDRELTLARVTYILEYLGVTPEHPLIARMQEVSPGLSYPPTQSLAVRP